MTKHKKGKKRPNIWKRHYYVRDLLKMHTIGKTLLVVFAVWLFGFVFLFFWIAQDARRTADSMHMPKLEYDEDIKQEVDQMTAGYPISSMSAYIAQFDRDTAAFLVGIAKKESDWGEHVPVKDGKDCFNYWGFRDPDNTEGSDGHTCFSSRQQAVLRVGGRIQELAREYGRDTPTEMVVWKCGSSCEGQSDESVQSWIDDVGYYYKKFINRDL